MCACLVVPEPQTEPAAAEGRPDAGGSAASEAVSDSLAPEVSLLTWNLEWFLDPTRGPADDARQLEGARRVLMALEPSVVALQELSSAQALERLLDGLGAGGHAITGFEWPQQIAVVHAERFTATSVRVLDALASAGRAPLEVVLLDTHSGEQLVVIALHAKAQADLASWNERHQLALDLHAYLEQRWAGASVIVLGDFNDGLTRSITVAQPSPYAELAADPRYALPTARLEVSASSGVLLDHIVVSDELALRVAATAERVDVAALGGIAESAVSDHAPIRALLR